MRRYVRVSFGPVKSPDTSSVPRACQVTDARIFPADVHLSNTTFRRIVSLKLIYSLPTAHERAAAANANRVQARHEHASDPLASFAFLSHRKTRDTLFNYTLLLFISSFRPIDSPIEMHRRAFNCGRSGGWIEFYGFFFRNFSLTRSIRIAASVHEADRRSFLIYDSLCPSFTQITQGKHRLRRISGKSAIVYTASLRVCKKRNKSRVAPRRFDDSCWSRRDARQVWSQWEKRCNIYTRTLSRNKP